LNKAKKKGLLFIVSAPAGTGKTTLVQMLSKEFTSIYVSISCTTRTARFNEIDGKDYLFLSKEQFIRKIKENSFLEYASILDNYYGTCEEIVNNKLEQGLHVFLVIDVQGAKQLRKRVEQAIFIFIHPPSLQELANRLIMRNTDSSESIQQRLDLAKKEIEQAIDYDYQIVNEDLMLCYQQLSAIFQQQIDKNNRYTTYIDS